MDSSVKRLEIQLERPNETYMPGELVSGKILAEFTKRKKIRGLKVLIVGESTVKWSAKSERRDREGHYHTTVFTGRDEYFSSKFYLLGSSSGTEIELPPGQLSYPFNIQLPINLPSSFEHNYGYVRYTIKAIFDRPWKFDHEVKKAFTIVSVYDLNQKGAASLAIRQQLQNDFCCCCVCSGSMSATISVPSSGFVPGQTIPVTIECENNSNVEIEKVKVSLRKELKFHASSPHWSTKEEEVMVAEEKSMTPFANKPDDPITIRLRVPPIPPSSLEYCNLIDLNYILRVVFCFSGMHCSVEHRSPVLIGTVPLRSSINFFTPSTTVLPPSAPIIQQPQLSGMPQPIGMPQPFGMPQPSVMPQPSGAVSKQPLGFVIGNPPYPSPQAPDDLPPPSYEESMYMASSIRDTEESEYVHGARVPFAPRYPVYNYNPANVVPNAPVPEKH